MNTQTVIPEIEYAEDDGLPLSEHTLQFDWIAKLVAGIDELFLDDPLVFVAGDLLWYPVEGDNVTRVAPDVMVVFGRPKMPRGSYFQWKEGGIGPRVVFEILSPGNRAGEMARKLQFYDRFDVEEYYLVDPETMRVAGWRRLDGGLALLEGIENWISPRLGIRFDHLDGELRVLGRDGRPFEKGGVLARHARQSEQRARDERQRADRLAEKLRDLGIDPDA